MQNLIVNTINFPEFTGVRCSMMPFIQGESSSLPTEYQPYADIIEGNYLEKGEIGFLTIDERFVEAGKTQNGLDQHLRTLYFQIPIQRKAPTLWAILEPSIPVVH